MATTPTTDHPPPSRQYLELTPTDAALNPTTVVSQFGRLCSLTRPTTAEEIPWYSRLWNRIASGPAPLTFEWLLVTDGDPDTPVRYFIGVDDDAVFDQLEQLCRALVPNEYELRRVDFHPAEIAPETTSAEDTPDAEPSEEREQLDSGDTLSDTDREPAEPARPANDHYHAIEFYGHAARRDDWMTQLTSFTSFRDDADTRLPLAAVLEALARLETPAVYQALLQPFPDWTSAATGRLGDLEQGLDTPAMRALDGIIPTDEPDTHRRSRDHPEQGRMDAIDAKDSRRSFVCTARIVARRRETNAEGTPPVAFDALENALETVSHTWYRIDARVRNGSKARGVRTDLLDRTVHPPNYDTLTAKLPWTQNTSRGIVVDPDEAPVFCLVDGGSLTTTGARALAPTPGERTALSRPPNRLLARYRGSGLPLGTPLTQDGTPDGEPLVLPPALQSLHVGIFAKTGGGKSVSTVNGVLQNHAATDGADIVIEPKGDGMAIDYLRAHYAEYGTLDNVLYFDCAKVLPAFGFFDIRDELDAGISRTTAVEDVTDHYVEILTQIMGRDRFEQAVRSPDVIRYMVKALFDPINGQDAFSHRELHGAVRKMHERQSVPPVSDGDLERMLGGVVANRAQTFDEIMQGVANRMEKIPVDQRLARIFNHVPEGSERDDDADDTDEPAAIDPHFDLADHLNENQVLIFDTGGLRSQAQRVLTLVVLSNLWTALRRRTQRGEDDALVNVYVEEAASVAVSDLLTELLAQSRGFNCSMMLAMQFPAQLRETDAGAYDEVLNNISTFVTGNVPIDRQLAARLATAEMDAQAVGNRLRALRRGQWLVSLPAAFGVDEPRPFTVESLPPPPGHPAGPPAEQGVDGFSEALESVRERTRSDVGLTLGEPSVAAHDESAITDDEDAPQLRVDTALPHTNRMPPTVEYAPEMNSLECTGCGNRYDPSIEGMKRAIACCSSLDAVDSDDVPICAVNLKLTPDERHVSDWSEHQLMFLQAVYNAQQLRYDPLEYDLLTDSMLRLQEYIAIGSESIQDLLDADLLRHDTDHPHRMYTVTPDGRSVIGESYRQGVDYGHGAGDLEESSQHVFAVEIGRRYLERAFVADPDSPVVEVVPYYDLDENRRLDIAGLDDEGDVVAAVEAERVNHDIKRAVPEDFDKMADCGVEDAIWVVMKQSDGHDVLQALNDPPEGEPRVEKTYAKTTPPQQFTIETPGLTAMYPAGWLRDRLADGELP
ncbi:ATP-binding protein [Halorarum halobium]|uniref:ATP-binding protein n=1 Tax=Halorarum halobium TaxID=3075121 RepID=UPI0028A61320|nr:ATP-binding protein [Halobaculum sp. XH14]